MFLRKVLCRNISSEKNIKSYDKNIHLYIFWFVFSKIMRVQWLHNPSKMYTGFFYFIDSVCVLYENQIETTRVFSMTIYAYVYR